MKIRVVLFDFDGTVIDTMGEYAESASNILSEETGIDKERAKELYLRTAGRDFFTQLRLIGFEGRVAQRAYMRFIEEKRKILRKKAISSYAIELINDIKKMGIIAALSTNNECSLIYEIPGIHAFSEILCFDGLDFRKGYPHLKKLQEKYSVREEEILFIGDSDYDIDTYSQLGLKSLKTKGIFDEHEAKRLLEEIKRIADGL
ncbi:MAG: HAD hydrolase-like protein [Fervidicoccaceae archaeon]